MNSFIEYLRKLRPGPELTMTRGKYCDIYGHTWAVYRYKYHRYFKHERPRKLRKAK